MLLALVMGCNLTLSPDEGGHILSSSGSMDCAEATCSFEVPAEGMIETFTAVPDDGYVFTGWGIPCQNNETDECVVDLSLRDAAFDYTHDLEAHFKSSIDLVGIWEQHCIESENSIDYGVEVIESTYSDGHYEWFWPSDPSDGITYPDSSQILTATELKALLSPTREFGINDLSIIAENAFQYTMDSYSGEIVTCEFTHQHLADPQVVSPPINPADPLINCDDIPTILVNPTVGDSMIATAQPPSILPSTQNPLACVDSIQSNTAINVLSGPFDDSIFGDAIPWHEIKISNESTACSGVTGYTSVSNISFLSQVCDTGDALIITPASTGILAVLDSPSLFGG